MAGRMAASDVTILADRAQASSTKGKEIIKGARRSEDLRSKTR
jgi:hypothetical protein